MPTPNPFEVQNKHTGQKNTVVIFIHGFTGEGVSTWEGFPDLVAEDVDLNDCIFYFWKYPTELSMKYLITKYFWEDDPNIQTIGQGLRTLLNSLTDQYQRLVLVGHSMGGLVIQTFILEEIARGSRVHLDRLTEVILYGTPSGGLKKARFGFFLKNQIADMEDYGPFIQKLRSNWKELIDDRRADPKRIARFRLTVVAGMKDEFVPQESSLDPFPFDEHEIVPGNHTEMVKPSTVGQLPFLLLKKRLRRPGLTAEQLKLINGESRQSIEYMNRVRAAAELGDVEHLVELGNNRLSEQAAPMPLVDRALGLALLDYESYELSAKLLTQYIEFRMDDDGSYPFKSDAQARQQLAIALSGAGATIDAVAQLEALDPQVRSDPETQGILAGRFKRQWLKSQTSSPIGFRAYKLYDAAFRSAKSDGNLDQVIYNGINAAYMNFALGKDEYTQIAEEVLSQCRLKSHPGYWDDATKAEALLLLGRYKDAADAYSVAFLHGTAPRNWNSTGLQALDIIRRQGDPSDAAPIAKMFSN